MAALVVTNSIAQAVQCGHQKSNRLSWLQFQYTNFQKKMIYFLLEINMENQVNVGNQNAQQIGQNDSSKLPQTSQKLKINWWAISTFFFAIAFATTFGYFATKSNNIKTPSITTENSKEETNKSTSTNQLDENQYPLPTYIGPGGYYQLYYISDSKTLDVKVYARTREITPKTIELLELKNNAAEFGEIVWTRGTTNNAKFILTSHLEDGSTYYLLGVDATPDLKDIKAKPAVTLKFKNDFSDLPYFSYFRVLTWIDDEKILVEQTDIQKDDQSKQTVSYWFAPALNLDQKKVVIP